MTKEPTCYVDIKSEELRDILRTILQDISGISLVEANPTVSLSLSTTEKYTDQGQFERALLYHYLVELKAHADKTRHLVDPNEPTAFPSNTLTDTDAALRSATYDRSGPDSVTEPTKGGQASSTVPTENETPDVSAPIGTNGCVDSNDHQNLRQRHVDLMIEYLEKTFASTTQRLASLLKHGQITYDLLWALFKPEALVFTTCHGTGKPRCVRFEQGMEKTKGNGVQCCSLSARYLDFDGDVLGEASIEYELELFRGAKAIHMLAVYPFQYHSRKVDMMKQLVECGRRFLSMLKPCPYQYDGKAFFMRRGHLVEVFVGGRIMVDAKYFRRINPDYQRSRIYDSGQISVHSYESSAVFGVQEQIPQLRNTGKIPVDLEEDDMLICSPTVLGFSFGQKLWAEFAVADVAAISWTPATFAQLALPPAQKDILLALAKARICSSPENVFDDIVKGKGQGLNVLLHGPPRVGKSLTAEGLSEYLQKPLYTISAGELGPDATQLEDRLSPIFELAKRWNAVLLLDEAEVFLEKRTVSDVHRNALVSVILRTLEYYQGILFLTTNRVQRIDDAIANRIHLKVKYSSLSLGAKSQVWVSFLEKAITRRAAAIWSRQDLASLANDNLNAREIENVVSTAHALATEKGVQVSISELESVIEAGKEFDYDHKGAGKVAFSSSYA
ncbi:MAG: hypothetical protein M4579_006477 [Chaenotheca gracillima]|nr:MAG: hypothetical protein M4579_006477 [Chaenotheca gracillima]